MMIRGWESGVEMGQETGERERDGGEGTEE